MSQEHHQLLYRHFLEVHDPDRELERLRSKMMAVRQSEIPIIGREDALAMADHIEKLILAVMYPPHATAS